MAEKTPPEGFIERTTTIEDAVGLINERLIGPPEDLAEDVEPETEGVVEPLPPVGFSERIKPPEGFVEREEEPTIASRIGARFLGTDVEDDLEVARMMSIIAGSIGGAKLGLKVPGPPLVKGGAALLLSGAGATLGAVHPEIVLEIGESFGLLDPGTRDRFGLSFEDLRTVAEGEALLDLVMGGFFTVLRITGRGVSRLATGITREGRKTAEAAAKNDIHLMPVQLGGRTLARGFVAVMGRFPIIGSSIRKQARTTEAATKKAFEGIPGRFGPLEGMSDVSERIFKSARKLVKDTAKHFDTEYTKLFKRAEELGAYVVPKSVFAKGQEILAKITRGTPTQVKGRAKAGRILEDVAGFIRKDILTLGKKMRNSIRFPKQTLEQLDGLIGKIDQEIASLDPNTRKFARSLLNQLRQAAQRDGLINIRGKGADEIARGMRELDTEFSHTMSQLFETATAKRFTSVQRKGLRGLARDEAMRMEVDQLARLVLKLDSPQAVGELRRLVSPDTFSRMTAQVLEDAIEGSFKNIEGQGRVFDVSTFASKLGLDKATGNRRKAIAKMLKMNGSGFGMKELDELIRAGKVIEDLPIPNVSSFIARRATIGGLTSVINGMIPGLVLAGGASGAAFAGGALIGVLTFLGGGKLIAAVISRPESARALSKVIGKEINLLIIRRAFTQVIRLGLQQMKADGDLDDPTFTKLGHIATLSIDALEKHYEALTGELLPEIEKRISKTGAISQLRKLFGFGE